MYICLENKLSVVSCPHWGSWNISLMDKGGLLLYFVFSLRLIENNCLSHTRQCNYRPKTLPNLCNKVVAFSKLKKKTYAVFFLHH